MDNFFSYVKATVTAVGEELHKQASLMADEGLGITYVGRQLIATGFPYDDSTRTAQGATVALPVPSRQHGGASVRQLATFLHKHHPDKFMVWNLSEKSYDYKLLDQQVIEFRFPGYPAAPLSQVFSLCNSIHAWLQADPANVAVLHCQTGRGRTICALAWYLAWSGQIHSVQAALLHVTGKMGLAVTDNLIIPTQKRYLDYLSAILAGKKPSSKPVRLERVLMNGIPALGDTRGTAGAAEGDKSVACRPYLQIFKDARLLYTSTGRDSSELRWYTAADSSVLFPVNQDLEGDILVRIRHLSADNKRVSMLRFGFHTGFLTPVPGNVRFLRAQLDGASTDPRFPESFFLDLVFRTAEEPDPNTEEGKRALETQKAQEQWWEQVNSARRQSPPNNQADLQVPAKAEAAAAEANAAGQPSAAAAASSLSSDPSAVNPALVTPAKSKPTFGSLFSTATSKLSTTLGSTLGGLSLFGNEGGRVGGGEESPASSAHLDLSNPEVAKLHAADEAALRKARRRAATEAAVAAALQLSPSARGGGAVRSAAAGSGAKASSSADTDSSFADLQAYVAGLGALDARQLEVDSDEEDEIATSPKKEAVIAPASGAAKAASPAAAPTAASASTSEQQDELDLDRAMQQHFEEEQEQARAASTAASSAPATAAAPTEASAAAQSEADLFASLGLPTTPMRDPATRAAATPAAAVSSASSGTAAATGADADADATASLEAELALLSASELDGAGGGGEGGGLDDADEAALLASLQDELGEEL